MKKLLTHYSESEKTKGEDECESLSYPSNESNSVQLNTESNKNVTRTPIRNRNTPDRYTPEGHYSAQSAINFEVTTPDQPTVKQAMSAVSSEVELWKVAINDELNSLAKETWKRLPHVIESVPRGTNILPTHLVLKIKRYENGNPTRIAVSSRLIFKTKCYYASFQSKSIRFKARIVAGGHLQVKGKDHDKV